MNNQVERNSEIWKGPKCCAPIPVELEYSTLPACRFLHQPWKHSQTHTFGVFMKASSHRHDQSLTQSPVPFPLFREYGLGLKIPRF